MSKSESVPKMFQNALPYPIPVITPIWGAVAATYLSFPAPFVSCSHLGLSRSTSAESSRATENSPSGHQLQLPEPTLHTQNRPNPLAANEHSCSLGRGDLNSGFVMT